MYRCAIGTEYFDLAKSSPFASVPTVHASHFRKTSNTVGIKMQISNPLLFGEAKEIFVLDTVSVIGRSH